jgi:hypothetical protein
VREKKERKIEKEGERKRNSKKERLFEGEGLS